jgi:hypothetical protein
VTYPKFSKPVFQATLVEIERVGKKIAADMVTEYQGTVKHWGTSPGSQGKPSGKAPPKFNGGIDMPQKSHHPIYGGPTDNLNTTAVVWAGTSHLHYFFVDHGTRPHPIGEVQEVGGIGGTGGKRLGFMATKVTTAMGFHVTVEGKQRPNKYMQNVTALHKPYTQPGELSSSPRQYAGPVIQPFGVNHPGIKARGFSSNIEKRFFPKFQADLRASTLTAVRISQASVTQVTKEI